MNTVTMLFVADVEATSAWYQQALGMESAHGGPEFEMLTSEDQLCLQLHRIATDGHDHEVNLTGPLGHGVVLVVYVNDAAAARQRVGGVNAEVVTELHFNETANMHEFVIRDPNGYSVMVCQAMWNQ